MDDVFSVSGMSDTPSAAQKPVRVEPSQIKVANVLVSNLCLKILWFNLQCSNCKVRINRSTVLKLHPNLNLYSFTDWCIKDGFFTDVFYAASVRTIYSILTFKCNNLFEGRASPVLSVIDKNSSFWRRH